MTHCAIFKSGITIGPTGGVRPCCAYNSNGTSDPKFNENWREHHVELSKHEGWLPGCAECKLSEDLNRPSLRQYYNRILSGQELEYWDIKINNTCNLACRMCDKTSSSTWESIIRNHSADWDDVYTQGPATGWHQDIDDILPHLATAKYVKFTGGEPFLIPHVKKIVDWLISEEVYVNIQELTFITNGSVDLLGWDERFKKFKKVNLLISVDAVGKRYEYIRSGSNWDTLNSNIDKIKKLNANIQILILPSALNVNHIHEVEEWCNNKQLNYSISTPVISPDFMSPQALDNPTLKDKLIEQMQIQDKIWGSCYREFIDD